MRYKIALCFALASLCGQAYAQDRSLGLKAGLLGAGLEYGQSLGGRAAFRLAANGSSFSFDQSEAGIRYEFGVEWDSVSLTLDVHPRNSPLRLSVGALRSENALFMEASISGLVGIGGSSFPASDIGRLTSRVEFDGTVPFGAIGWDWSKDRRFGFSFDLGLMLQGDPQVTMTADGILGSDQNFQLELAAEEAELQDALKNLDTFPYATLGIVFRF